MHGLTHHLRLYCRLLLAVLFLVGCAGPGKKLEPPRITLTNIQVQEIKVFESVFQIELRVVNPNDVAIIHSGHSISQCWKRGIIFSTSCKLNSV